MYKFRSICFDGDDDDGSHLDRMPITSETKRCSSCSSCGSRCSRSFVLLIFYVLALTELSSRPASAWMPDVRPDLQPKQDKILARFVGNSTGYFKILDYDDSTILVGARNFVFNVSLHGLRERNRIEWYSSDADRELCALKGKHEADCHNYIRVFARLNDGQLLLCGTNSYKPRCRNYAPVVEEEGVGGDDGAHDAKAGRPLARYEVVRDVEAQGLCPYSPAHNSTYVFADGQLYSATVADFSGSDPLIYRENLRTEQYDLKQLNQPDFVGAIERDGYVLIFFREISMEYMNFGKTIYSRVGRVCKNDRGGPYTLSKSWTSFLKARLNCSVPGEFPFYFDEIQSISPVIESGDNSLIYAVFTTSVNAIPGSAVCAFNVDDIMDAFEGRFISQKDSGSHWLPLQEEHVPEPRPGKCVEDSRMLSSIAVNFVKNHPLMESAVPPVFSRPLLTTVNLHHRLTTIAVDARILALNGEYYDVIFTGTDDGKITKFINVPTPSNEADPKDAPPERLRTVVISETQVLPVGVPVRELVVFPQTNTLLVVSDERLVTVPLHHCSYILDCAGCLTLQDPYCAWDQKNHECKSLAANSNKFGTKSYLQMLSGTKKEAAALCPKTLRGTLLGEGPVLVGSVASVSVDVSRIPPASSANEATKSDDSLMGSKLHYAQVDAGATHTMGGGHADADDANAIRGVGGDDGGPSGAGGDFILNPYNDENKITLQHLDPNDLMNSLSAADLLRSRHTTDDRQLQRAGQNHPVLMIVSCVFGVFVVGLACGMFFTRRCKSTPTHASHRNEFNSNSLFNQKHPNGKDINLLMNPSQFCTKIKPGLDLEKDRSHECKNSTENLEKEIPCKTSTLTKVKRTYI